MYVYVQNVKNPQVRFEVMEYDKETKVAKLKGGFGVVFSRNISKEELTKHGYAIVKSEKELSLTPTPSKKPVTEEV